MHSAARVDDRTSCRHPQGRADCLSPFFDTGCLPALWIFDELCMRNDFSVKRGFIEHHDFSESERNELGYALLRMKKIDEAVKILALNVEVYPRSANAYDSLGEAVGGLFLFSLVWFERSLRMREA